jgi:hypothetical protein
MDSHFRKDHDGIRWMNLREFLLDQQDVDATLD